MKRPILHAGLIFTTMALGQAGCHQADKAKAVTKAPKPDDPTAWTDKDVARGSSDSGSDSGAMPPSDGVKGTWSSQAQDIEKSLGVTR